MQINEYIEIAKRVRRAIESSDRTNNPCLMAFPKGACGEASDLLARLLNEKFDQHALYVLGHKGDQSHAWVENEGIIIDITTDQFGEPPIIVETDSLWHAQWAISNKHAPNIPSSSNHCPGYPEKAWDAIMYEFSES